MTLGVRATRKAYGRDLCERRREGFSRATGEHAAPVFVSQRTYRDRLGPPPDEVRTMVRLFAEALIASLASGAIAGRPGFRGQTCEPDHTHSLERRIV